MNNFIDITLAVRLLLTLMHSLWEGTAIALLAGTIVFALRGSMAAMRYQLFFAAMILTAVAAVVTFARLAPSAEALLPRSASIAAPGVAKAQERIQPPMAQASGGDATPVDSEPAGANPAFSPILAPAGVNAPAKSKFDWKRYATPLVEIYAFGVLLMLLRLGVAIHGVRRLRIAARPIADQTVLDALHRQAARLGLRFLPVAYYSGRVLVPTVVGILRPAVLLPVSISTGLSIDAIEAVLAHELAHIRRYDHLFQLMQRLIEAAFFFHPAVWYLSRRIHAERENACDDLAVGALGTRCDYANALLAAAEICVLARRTSASVTLAMADRPGGLRQRISRLIEPAADSRFRLPGVCTALGVLVLAVILVVGCQNSRVASPTAALPTTRPGQKETPQTKPTSAASPSKPATQPGQSAVQATEPDVVTRIYDIRDLLMDVPANQAELGGGQMTRQQEADLLVSDVYTRIAPGTWIGHGGEIGSISEFQGDLIVTATPETQDEITTMLLQIRDQRPHSPRPATRSFPMLVAPAP